MIHGELYVAIFLILQQLQWRVINWGFQITLDITFLVLYLGKQVTILLCQKCLGKNSIRV